MKQERREDIHTLESKFLYHREALFLNYNIFHELLSNKQILVVL